VISSLEVYLPDAVER